MMSFVKHAAIVAAATVSFAGNVWALEGTWTGSDWTSGFVPAENNLLKGLIPTNNYNACHHVEGGAPITVLTDGVGEVGNKYKCWGMAHKGVLSYQFPKAVSISEVRIYATHGDDNRDAVAIESVIADQGQATETKIGGDCVIDITEANCGTLSAGGKYMAKGITSLTINFADRKTAYENMYAEIEAIGIEGLPSATVVGITSSAEPGLEPWTSTFTIQAEEPFGVGATYDWKLDGRQVGTASTVTLENMAAGAYQITVTVSEGGRTCYGTNNLPVYGAVAYLDSSNKTPVYPYWSKETAATNVDSVLTAFALAKTLSVAPGRYEIPSFHVPEGKCVKGDGAAEDVTFVRRSDAKTRLVNVAGAGSVIKNVTLDGNRTGNGILCVSDGGRCEGCRFVHGSNERTGSGGCLLVQGASSVVTNCFVGNTLMQKTSNWDPICYGLGIRLEDGLVTHCVISNVQNLGMHRSAQHGHAQGVGVHMSGGTLRNCLVVKNACSDGTEGSERRFAAGVYQAGGKIENCTITANSAGSGPAGYCRYNAGTMVNTIVADNVNNDTEGVYGDADVGGSGAQAMTNCLTNSPCFRNPSAGDFRLRGESPAVNAGSWMALGATKDAVKAMTDLAGASRLVGSNVDIGCYECLMPGFTVIVR